ncbi:MAG: peptidyl-prolyl cis-trans isomerase [Polyangiaceae bacterium]
MSTRVGRSSRIVAVPAIALAAVVAVSSLASRPAALTLATPARAADPPSAPPADSDVVVARVGSTNITAAELEKRLSQTSRAALQAYGSTPEEIRRNFLERVLIRDALIAEEARDRKLDAQRDVRDRSLGVLRAALLEDLRHEIRADDISDAEVRAYFDANSGKFKAPPRIGLYRILVNTEADARAILSELGSKPDQKKWNDLARDKSLDSSTNLHGGDLGFVAEDGATDHADHVDVALFKAAQKVKDGELVPEPVVEGDKFAVVWKRETMRGGAAGFENEAPRIRATITDERTRDAAKKLLETLRTTEVKEMNVELCDMVTVNAVGELERAKRPGVLPRSRRGAQPVPTEGSPGGLR